MPSVLDHFQPTTDDPAADGHDRDGAPVYRVVGAGDPVALLRVTDDAGRRVSSGELRHVPVATLDAAWEPAPDPDADLHPVRGVRNGLSGIYWQFRRLL